MNEPTRTTQFVHTHICVCEGSLSTHFTGTRSPRAAAADMPSRWLAQHKADFYVREAMRLGYRTRAAFKLLQLDARLKKPPLLKRGGVALELGAAPGSWTQVLVQRGMEVVAVDLLPSEPVSGATFVCGDFTHAPVQRQLLDLLGDRKIDLLLSDMSPNRSGHGSLDESRLVDLIEQSLPLAELSLRPRGSAVWKALQGQELMLLMKRIKKQFDSASLIKPPASRQGSREIYLCARGFKPLSQTSAGSGSESG